MGENRRVGLLALFITIFCFGTLWTVAKVSIDHLPPLWFTAGRFAIGALFVSLILWVQGRMKIPDRADVAIILSVGGIMLGLYSSIFQNALEFVEVGRATILGYTTAIFVTPVAVLFLGEKLTFLRGCGLAAAVTGFLLLFSPAELDWSDRNLLLGNGLLVLCVVLWSGVIIHLRLHRKVSDTLSLVPWYLVVSCVVATTSGLIFEGPPVFEISSTGWALFLYAGIVGSGIGNWGVTTAILNLPATTSTVGLLGVPVFAMILSVLLLGELLTLPLGLGMILIVGGIAAVTVSRDH
ncbi:MAG: DMT family transporter [Pseudomonadota bacterium]|nr:DMT family transporter [Pseudomonadota bacterium]